jgi:prepilin-type N-terminal cleavage/methylation domain-containing protein
MQPDPIRFTSGFTLLETLVATSVLVTVLALVYVNVLRRKVATE